MRQARAVRTRAVILEAAAEVFDEQGFERATISEILRRAEVTKGALYFHFSSKAALAEAVLEVHTSVIPPPPQRAGLQALIDYTQAVAHAMRHHAVLRAGTRLTIESTFDARVDPYRAWAEAVAGMLAGAKERGEVLPHIRELVVAELIVGSFSGVGLISEVRTRRDDLPDRVAELWRHLLPAVATPALLGVLLPGGREDCSECRSPCD